MLLCLLYFVLGCQSSPPTNNSHQIIQPVKNTPSIPQPIKVEAPLYLRQYIEQHDWKAAFVYIDNAYLVNEDTGKVAEFLAAYPEIAFDGGLQYLKETCGQAPVSIYTRRSKALNKLEKHQRYPAKNLILENNRCLAVSQQTHKSSSEPLPRKATKKDSNKAIEKVSTKNSYCSSLAEIAKNIMDLRQGGTSYSELRFMFRNSEVRDIIFALISDSTNYPLRLYESDGRKEEVSYGFKEDTYKLCIKKTH